MTIDSVFKLDALTETRFELKPKKSYLQCFFFLPNFGGIYGNMLLLVSKYFEIMILVETKPHDSKIIIELDIQIYKVCS